MHSCASAQAVSPIKVGHPADMNVGGCIFSNPYILMHATVNRKQVIGALMLNTVEETLHHAANVQFCVIQSNVQTPTSSKSTTFFAIADSFRASDNASKSTAVLPECHSRLLATLICLKFGS